jgi:hypothetical protein
MDFSWKELLDLSYYMGSKRFTQGATVFKEGDTDIFMSVVPVNDHCPGKRIRS